MSTVKFRVEVCIESDGGSKVTLSHDTSCNGGDIGMEFDSGYDQKGTYARTSIGDWTRATEAIRKMREVARETATP